jgi:hypothetical protein
MSEEQEKIFLLEKRVAILETKLHDMTNRVFDIMEHLNEINQRDEHSQREDDWDADHVWK